MTEDVLCLWVGRAAFLVGLLWFTSELLLLAGRRVCHALGWAADFAAFVRRRRAGLDRDGADGV